MYGVQYRVVESTDLVVCRTAAEDYAVLPPVCHSLP